MPNPINPITYRNHNMLIRHIVEDVADRRFTAPFEILDIDEMVTSDACIVRITVVIQGDEMQFTGSARRARGDDSNLTVGYFVALGRALESMSKRVNRRARGLVRHYDWVQEEKANRLLLGCNDENDEVTNNSKGRKRRNWKRKNRKAQNRNMSAMQSRIEA